jgi:hypothetical protein
VSTQFDAVSGECLRNGSDSVYAGLRALPHSRQHLFWRGVINPQKGHILCNLKFWFSGLGIARELINKSAMKASFLQKGLSSRRKLGAIDLPYALSPVAGIVSRPARAGCSEMASRFICPAISEWQNQAMRCCAGLLTSFGEATLENETSVGN